MSELNLTQHHIDALQGRFTWPTYADQEHGEHDLFVLGLWREEKDYFRKPNGKKGWRWKMAVTDAGREAIAAWNRRAKGTDDGRD